MKKTTNTYHACLSIIMAIIVVTAFTINLREIDYAVICKWVNSDNILARYIAKWRYILSGYGMYNSLFVLALTVLLYRISWETKFKTIRDYSIMILAAVFSVFMIVGHSYSVSNSWKLAFGGIFYISVSVVRFIGFFISFYYGIRWVSYQMQLKENQLYFYANQKANAITIWLFEKHSWGRLSEN